MSTILARGLAKFNSVSCLFNSDAQKVRHVAVELTPAARGLVLDKAKVMA
jgi:hypothetical protein